MWKSWCPRGKAIHFFSQRCEKERARAVKARAQRRIVGWIYTTDKFLSKVHQTWRITPPRYRWDRWYESGSQFRSRFWIVPEHGWAWGWKSRSEVFERIYQPFPTLLAFLETWFYNVRLGWFFPFDKQSSSVLHAALHTWACSPTTIDLGRTRQCMIFHRQ